MKFKKHKYKMVCESCGKSTEENDNNVIEKCRELRISHCQTCCPQCAVGSIMSVPYDENGERINI